MRTDHSPPVIWSVIIAAGDFMGVDANRSVEEIKSIFRDYLNSNPITETDAISIIEQIKQLVNTNDIQLKMISRSLLGKIETLYPGKFDLSFINDDVQKNKKSAHNAHNLPTSLTEALMIQIKSEVSGPFTIFQLRQMWASGQIDLNTKFFKPDDKEQVLLEDVLKLLEENSGHKSPSFISKTEFAEKDSQTKAESWLGCFVKSFFLFLFLIFIISLVSPRSSADKSFSAHYMAEEFVKKSLKVPDSATFSSYSECKISTVVASNTWLVEGWVKSQNLFGVTLKKKYKCLLMSSGENRWSLLGLDFLDN